MTKILHQATIFYNFVDLMQALLAASNLLGVTAVQEACCHFMERHMDVKNCVGIHCFAELHSCERLMKHSMDYILEHFSDVYQQVSEGYVHLQS